MLPQPASDIRKQPRNNLKQGVVRVIKVKEKFIMPDGSVKDKDELTPEELGAISQKIMDELISPLAYDLVVKDMQPKKAAN